MRPAAALEAREPIADLLLGRVGRVAQQRRRRHDPAIEAVAALRRLLLNEGKLQFVRRRLGAQARERGNGTLHFGERQLATAHGSTAEQHGARTALSETAPEARVAQLQIIAQRVEKWHGRIRIHLVSLAIHLEDKAFRHGAPPLLRRQMCAGHESCQ